MSTIILLEVNAMREFSLEERLCDKILGRETKEGNTYPAELYEIVEENVYWAGSERAEAPVTRNSTNDDGSGNGYQKNHRDDW